MDNLFSKLKIRDVSFKNRIFVSPMCQYSALNGVATDWHLVHLGSRAVGGAGLVMLEATSVSPEGRISPDDLGIWNVEQQLKLKTIVDFMHVQQCAAGIQLAHAGRKASTAAPWSPGPKVLSEKDGGWTCLAPSPIPFDANYPAPREMTAIDMEKVISDFVSATKRCEAAGFDVIEIHMAHGYLLHEFLSPLSNKRTDQYGGVLENRIRLPLLVATEVRKVWPSHLPLFVRISATDWVEGGWNLDESVVFCRQLREVGVDLIDCSSGGQVPYANIKIEPGYQVPFARRIKDETGLLTGAVGLITQPEHANEIVLSGKADAVLIGRESLRDPYWPHHAALKLGITNDYPKQYGRAKT